MTSASLAHVLVRIPLACCLVRASQVDGGAPRKLTERARATDILLVSLDSRPDVGSFPADVVGGDTEARAIARRQLAVTLLVTHDHYPQFQPL